MIEKLFDWLNFHLAKIVPLVTALLILDCMLWFWVIADVRGAHAMSLSFLNVGQGDAELITFPGGRTMLIDGGPADGSILSALAPLLPPTHRTIDVVALTHAQADHLTGLIDVVKHYRVDAFVWTGRAGSGAAYNALMKALKDNHVKMLTLREGDAIRSGAGVEQVLSPNAQLAQSKDLNDSSLVLKISFASTTALFTGDVAKGAERQLAQEFPAHVDILKVPHHGSRTALIDEFVRTLSPVLSVIEVGKNSYGHPTSEALASLASVGSRVFRTDKDGTVTMRITNDGLVHLARE